MHRREEGGACVSTCIRLETLHAPLPRPPEKERFPQRLPLPRTFGLGSHPTSRVPLPSLPAPPSTQVPPPRGYRLASPRLATAWALPSARAGRPLVGRGLAGTLCTSVCSRCSGPLGTLRSDSRGLRRAQIRDSRLAAGPVTHRQAFPRSRPTRCALCGSLPAAPRPGADALEAFSGQDHPLS